MPLIFNRSLKNDQWITTSHIPSCYEGKLGDYCFKNTTQNIFKKDIPILDCLVFDKNSKHPDVSLSDDYKICFGGQTSSSLKGSGIKSLPFEQHSRLLFSLRINSTGHGNPMVGFCNETDDISQSNDIINSVLWNLNEPVLKYFYKGKIYKIEPLFAVYKSIKKDDIINIAIDIEMNKIWYGINYKWSIGRPHLKDPEPLEFLPSYMSGAKPILYIIPSGYEIEIVSYTELKPSLYQEAKSIGIEDWYLDKKYFSKE